LTFAIVAAIGVVAALGLVTRSTAATHAAGATIPLFRIADSAAYGTVDPRHTDGCNTLSCATIFDRLMAFDTKGNIVGQLAQSVTHPGKAVYVYHLRHDVKFWDGTTLTADDVTNSINYERYPGSNSAGTWNSVKTITAPDKWTVVFTLKHVDAGFQYVPVIEGPVFEKAFQQAHKDNFGEAGVGVMASGPWILKSFNPTTGLEMDANPHYWGGKVNIQHISIRFLSDETAEALAMRAGEIDFATPFNPPAFQATSGIKVVNVPAAYELWDLAMNVTKPPWNDVHVRRAVAYAVKRDDLVKASGTVATPSYYMIPWGQLVILGQQAGLNLSQLRTALKDVPTYQYSVAKAKAELAKSAYPNGFTESTDVGNCCGFPGEAQALQAQLKAIGINLQLHTVTVPQWLDELFGPKSFGFMINGDGWPTPDPGGFPSFDFGSKNTGNGGLNLSHYGPPAVDALLKQGLGTLDPKKRLPIYVKFLKIVQGDVPDIPVFEPDTSMALAPKFKFPAFNSLTMSASHWPLLIQPAG
jgi:peptide/nickel transport system substrate-binding protein